MPLVKLNGINEQKLILVVVKNVDNKNGKLTFFVIIKVFSLLEAKRCHLF
jgi:hypothetical protein